MMLRGARDASSPEADFGVVELPGGKNEARVRRAKRVVLLLAGSADDDGLAQVFENSWCGARGRLRFTQRSISCKNSAATYAGISIPNRSRTV